MRGGVKRVIGGCLQRGPRLVWLDRTLQLIHTHKHGCWSSWLLVKGEAADTAVAAVRKANTWWQWTPIEIAAPPVQYKSARKSDIVAMELT